jgi:hypothetical protein
MTDYHSVEELFDGAEMLSHGKFFGWHRASVLCGEESLLMLAE